MTPRLVLGIESSCDEMAAALVRDGREVLASRVHGQDALHRPYGGVVPELASRDHVRQVSQVVRAALAEAGVAERELDAVAVTMGPGLLGSLLVGLSFGKALAYRLGVPVVGVHHLAGHLAAAELVAPGLARPYLGLVVSGGHTALYRVEEGAPPKLLGETSDDAVGEAFDKVAKLLGLPFPGGPALARLAEGGREDAFALPRPRLGEPGYDFSYSGLKTAVARIVRAAPALDEATRRDLAASFQAAATDVLVAKARRALEGEALARLAVVGGVAANERLRRRMEAAARADGFEAIFPPPAFCTDNAAMIAAAGARALAAGERHDLDLTAFSRLPLSTPAPPRHAASPAQPGAQRAEGERSQG
jgi:N6-L-threonylcarbamoyladenine synthase